MLDTDKMVYRAAIRILNENCLNADSIDEPKEVRAAIQWAVQTAREVLREVIRTEVK